MEILGIAIIGGGLVILVVGFLLSCGGQYPKCWRCKAPLVGGFEGTEEGGHVCRECCRRHGIRPWYWKDVLGDWPGKGAT